MSYVGNVVFNVVMTATPELVAEGERIFASHAAFMGKTHHREGEKALLTYSVTKAKEFKNAMDPAAGYTGNIQFVIFEIYDNPAGLMDHWQQAQENWADFGALNDWLGKVNMVMVNGGEVLHSHWD